jgi:HEPN domain-containing protein
MKDEDIAQEWMQIAYEDYDTAAYLFDNKRPKPLEIICYHCQQSVEKSLKGYLCIQDAEIPKTHEVGLLCRRCAEFNDKFADFFVDCEEIEIYATKTRYPNRIEVEEHNAEQALKQALRVYNFVSEQLREIFAVDENQRRE